LECDTEPSGQSEVCGGGADCAIQHSPLRALDEHANRNHRTKANDSLDNGGPKTIRAPASSGGTAVATVTVRYLGNYHVSISQGDIP